MLRMPHIYEHNRPKIFFYLQWNNELETSKAFNPVSFSLLDVTYIIRALEPFAPSSKREANASRSYFIIFSFHSVFCRIEIRVLGLFLSIFPFFIRLSPVSQMAE